ncbi:MAG: hypothetical protein JSR46_09245, partial [Verrucomicrobia bacterium]|nr:hypothetical protein [Verrucomicrobiota bacterium]
NIDPVWLEGKIDSQPRFHHLKEMTPIEMKMLFHIHANEFGENNESLEGYQRKNTLSYLHNFLSKRKEQNLSTYGLSQETMQEIESAIQLSTDFKKTAPGAINAAFNNKTPLLLPGGWAGSPSGHAMYYELIPTSPTEATLRIFNLGAGSEAHAAAVVGTKEKRLPYIDFRGVPKELLTDVHTLQSMDELLEKAFFPDSAIEKTEYEEKDIYDGLKKLLQPKEIYTGDDLVSPHELKTPQYSGVCTWRSLLAYLSTKMSKNEYKQLILDMKLQSLIDGVRACDGIPSTKSQWHLIERSHKKLARSVAKAYAKGIVGTTYLMQSQIKLKKIENWLHERREKIFTPFASLATMKYLQVEGSLKKEPLAMHAQPLHLLATAQTQVQEVPSYSFACEQLQKAPDISSVLQIATKMVAAKDYHALHVGLSDFVR